MLAVFPFCQSDLADEKRLQLFIQELGGVKGHTCLLVVDQDCDWLQAIEIRDIAEKSFDKVDIICDGAHAGGWIAGGNSKFKAAALWAKEHGEAFYFNESDAIPLKFGWLDAIQSEYEEKDVPFMGAIVHHQTPNFPNPYMEGNSVYSQDTYDLIQSVWQDNVTWVNSCASIFVPHSVNSKLFFCVWGEAGNPPIFSTKSVPATSVFCLKNIPPEAVVFHRSKGGSLIRQLQRARGTSQPINVIFPVCPSDIGLAITHARWLRQMGKVHQSPAIIAFDATINISQLTAFRNELQATFPNIDLFKYPVPPVMGWPQAPNWALQSVARHMAQQENPWLWYEADCVALVPDWVEQIEDEYFNCGRSWMGPIVKGMGHMNGGGVYPPDAALRSSIMMTCRDRAWDYDMKPQMVHDCHDASHLMRHIWTVVGDDAIETGGGETPARVTVDRIKKWVQKSHVCIHRIKDDSLLGLLLRGEYIHGQ